MTVLLPIRPMHDFVFIDIVDRDMTIKDLGNGKVLHLIADDSFSGPHNAMEHTHPGIRPRWARVLEIGPKVHDLRTGDLVLCDTLKWGRRIPLGKHNKEIVYFWTIKAADILLVDSRGSGEYLRQARVIFSQMDFNVGRL